ncbi:MAG: hypothetical protein AAF329_28260, partial [Cyanobacteria bacterium P01_A01_bin.17]
DFSPEFQDAAAIELLRERGVLESLESDDFESAVYQASSAWTTLPQENGETVFGERIYSVEQLKSVYSIFLEEYQR